MMVILALEEMLAVKEQLVLEWLVLVFLDLSVLVAEVEQLVQRLADTLVHQQSGNLVEQLVSEHHLVVDQVVQLVFEYHLVVVLVVVL